MLTGYPKLLAALEAVQEHWGHRESCEGCQILPCVEGVKLARNAMAQVSRVLATERERLLEALNE